MSLFTLKNYTYNQTIDLDTNLEMLVMFHKYQLLKMYSIIKPLVVDEHNRLIAVTNDVIDTFKIDIATFKELADIELKWQWIGKIKAEQSLVLEKSIIIINKLNLP